MISESVRNDLDYYSKTASKVNRQLSIAGVASVFLFVKFNVENIELSTTLAWSLFLFITSVFLDLVHYSVSFISLWLTKDNTIDEIEVIGGAEPKSKVIKKEQAENTNTTPAPLYTRRHIIFNNSIFIIKILCNIAAYFLLIYWLYNFIKIV